MFEAFFQNLLSPDFAVKAAQAMDPAQFMNSLNVGMGTGTDIIGQALPGGASFASMLGLEGAGGSSVMPNDAPFLVIPQDTPSKTEPKKLGLGAKELQALSQATADKTPQRPSAPSAGIVSPRGNFSIIPLAVPDTSTRQRNPTGVSLGQLLYGR
jgi:hypothetical protein